MPRRQSEQERLISFAWDASDDSLNAAIQTLIAIRNKKFPPVKATRKARKKAEPTEAKTRRKKTEPGEDIGSSVARKCLACGNEFFSSHPMPCEKCGGATEVAE